MNANVSGDGLRGREKKSEQFVIIMLSAHAASWLCVVLKGGWGAQGQDTAGLRLGAGLVVC